MNAAQIVNFHVANAIDHHSDVVPDGEFAAIVRWRRGDVRRTLHLNLGQEIVDDFNNLNDRQQDQFGERLREGLRRQLAETPDAEGMAFDVFGNPRFVR